MFIADDDFFEMGKDFVRLKFQTNDKFPYNKNINVAVCVISISNVFEERGWYYPHIMLQDCFYGNAEILQPC